MEVEMDVSGVHHHHHQQEMSSQTLESMLVCTKAQEDKKPRPPEEALKCPRCDSSNTKFCYYNNYSLTQPRYFCKSCRRYWTKGGTLRNVPVGGGCRRNKRSSSATSTSSSALTNLIRPQDHPHLIQHHHHQPSLNIITSNHSNGSGNNPLLSGLSHLPYDSTCTDLSLAFARLQSQANANGHMGYDHNDHQSDQLSFLDAIRGGFLENTNTLNGFHNLYNEGNIGNLIGLNNGNHTRDQDQEMMNPMFNNHQESPMMNNGTTCGASATTAMTMATVKQETCNMMRSSSEFGDNNRTGGGVLWGFPWQMGAGGGVVDQGNMVHEVESGKSQIGNWNGFGSTNWHGLINSPLM